MTSSLIGMTVARTVPDATLLGLATGQYSLHGGVIRWATGTPQAGQIICHLVPALGAAGAPGFTGVGIVAQTAAVAGTLSLATAAVPILAGVAAIGGIVSSVIGGISLLNTFKILKVARRTMMLAEMHLAATQVGFASLNQRLQQLEATLADMKTTVTAILKLLQIEQRAELRIALDHLNRIDLIQNEHVRRELLIHSATTLGKIGLIYEQRLNEADKLPELMICEEYYCIAMLAQVRCYAELRELAMARCILETTHKQWQIAARSIMWKHLIGHHPEKYLGSQFADHVSIMELADWLDFTHADSKGLAWIDELRTKSDPWYFFKEPSGVDPSRRMVRSVDLDEIVVVRQTLSIPAMRKLVARNSVLETHIAQYELMEQQQLTAHEFEAQLTALSPDDQVDGFFILMSEVEELVQ